MAFLDETGLQTLWTKIKNTFALINHSHSSSDVSGLATVATSGSYNDLTNKPNIPASATIDTALSSTSTNPVQNKIINTALETKANDADVVKLSGNQTIAGTKTFSSTITGSITGNAATANILQSGGSPNFQLKCLNSATYSQGLVSWSGVQILTHALSLNKGSSPSSNTYCLDINAMSADATADEKEKRIGAYQVYVHSSGSIANEISTYRNIAGNTQEGTKLTLWNSIDQATNAVTITNAPLVIPYENVSVRRDNKTGALRLTGGNSASAADGAMLSLFGSSNSLAGYFRLYTGNGPCLEGRPNGTLTWNDKSFVYTSTDQTISDIKTFSSATPLKFTANEPALRKDLASTPSATRGISLDVYNTTKSFSMSHIGGWWSADNTGITFSVRNISDTTFPYYGVSLRSHSNTNEYFEPTTANIYLGRNATGYKWKQLIADTTTISTSDERLKSSIAAIPDDVLDAWNDIDWKQFQFNDAIQEKGIETARLHTGLIAQAIQRTFQEHNLDASRYGFWCYDHWDAEPEERDESGNITMNAHGEEDAYAIRYEEALCMEAAYQRRRADRAEARIAVLEEEIIKIKRLLGVE